jgi:hypothetical protein
MKTPLPRERVLAKLAERNTTPMGWYRLWMFFSVRDMSKSDLAEWLVDLIFDGCQPATEEDAWTEIEVLWQDNTEDDFWMYMEVE